MLCLHGEPVGSRLIELSDGDQIRYDYCQQPSTCHYRVVGEDEDLYCKAVKTFLKTNQKVPKCCAVHKPPGKDLADVERNNAKMKVWLQKDEDYGRPYFVCPEGYDGRSCHCKYFEWGDKIIDESPLCKHGYRCGTSFVNGKFNSFWCACVSLNIPKWLHEYNDPLMEGCTTLSTTPPSYMYTVRRKRETFVSHERDRQKAYIEFLRRDLLDPPIKKE